jgi:Tol biopolymer transport system component
MTHHIWLFAIVVGLVVVACQGSGESALPPEQEATKQAAAPEDSGSGVTVNRIAFVNATGDLFTIEPNGSGLRPLTGGVQAGTGSGGPIQARPLNLETFYAWPTWSPDGTRIAISTVDTSNNRLRATIQLIDTTTARTKTIYSDEPRSMVASGAPHYVYWSPDSRYLAFIAPIETGLALFISDSTSNEEPVAMALPAPLYFHWAENSDSLLIHTGAEVKLVHQPFTGTPQSLLTTTTPFRAPALSPDGGRFAYIQEDPAGAGLFVAAVDGPSDAVKLVDVGPLSAFAWSPDGQELAVADQQRETNPIFQRLLVISADGEQIRTIGEGQILAFYWSPLGDKIAWVVVQTESLTFEWMVADRTGEGTRSLFRFQPSSDVFTMLSFFDQYAYSHSPWSPDGTQLVVAGKIEPASGRSNGQTPTGDRVFVVAVTGTPAPQDIAAGTLAFWSWN